MTYIAPALKLFGHMDRLAQITDSRMTTAPVNAEIDLSNRCSLACEYCHFGFTHVAGPLAGKRPKPPGAIPGGDLMDRGLAEIIVRELAHAGVRSITWTGGGEPCLYPDFDAIVAYTSRFDLAQSLYTNGCHIKQDRAALLKDALTFVYVSLDAANAEMYKQLKRVSRFDEACAGIRRLVDAEGAATVGIGYLVTEDNWRDIPAAVALRDELGADYIQFRPTIRYDQVDPDMPAEETEWLDDALLLLTEFDGVDGVEVDLERFRMYRDWTGHGYHTCWWSTLQTCITPNGFVWTCVNRREHPSAKVGDLSTESFRTIWARHMAATVSDDCRVMCRGHLSNITLATLIADRPHAEFI